MEQDTTRRQHRSMKGHPLHERFWSKVDRRGADECWPWTGWKSKQGYGSFWYAGSSTKAHRVAYSLTFGAIQPGMLVCHRCDNPPCCNPTHLFLGTIADNNADKYAKGRQPILVGENAPHAKLSDATVLHLRELHATGLYTQRELSRLFNIGQAQVWRIAHRLSRTDI
jgi:hypothetical protein